MRKIQVYKIILGILIVILLIEGSLVIKKYYDSYQVEKKSKEAINNIKEEFEKNENLYSVIDNKLGEYKIIGIIKIPKIELEYPILEETTIDSLKYSITKFWGGKINEIGNLSLAGHNNFNGTMFGKIKKLDIGDIIELTDEQNITIKYEVFKKYVIDPNDITCILPEDSKTREVTLITCTNGRHNRLIVKAREIDKK